MLYHCDKCIFETYVKNYLEKHIKLHNSPEKGFKCNVCGYLTIKIHRLKRHKNIHEKIKNYNCGKCNFSNKCLKLTKDHFFNSHMKLDLLSEDEVFLNLKVETPVLPLIEMELKPPLVLPSIEKELGPPKKFSCSECDFKTQSRCSYSRHRKNHDKTKRFFCDICDFKTHSKGCLYYHHKKHFKGEFECKECNKFYTRRIDLKYHNDKNHPIEEEEEVDPFDFSKGFC